MSLNQKIKVAVIAGDGIGEEVVPEGVRVLRAISQKLDFHCVVDFMDWGNCDYYLQHGRMMPKDWKSTLMAYDAVFLGAVGWPDTVPDHISLWGSLLEIRREFNQYVNLRPVRLFDGVPCPLANMEPGDIDFSIVRENTEGEYTDIGGIMFKDTERELVLQQSVHTRIGTDRILRYAMELAAATPAKKLTVATKSNGLAVSMPWWDARAATIASREYPNLAIDTQHIDALSARFVLKPQTLNVVVAPNLFGDILSDLGPACTGTIGLAPSANINPTHDFPSLFEPVHGSAPDISGLGLANPVGAIWSVALLLKHNPRLTEHTALNAHDQIITAIEKVLKCGPKTPDLGGDASTIDMGVAIAAAIEA